MTRIAIATRARTLVLISTKRGWYLATRNSIRRITRALGAIDRHLGTEKYVTERRSRGTVSQIITVRRSPSAAGCVGNLEAETVVHESKG